MREALYLRFAGPLQSWAGPRISGFVSRTNPYPTRTGIEGLLAGALGLPRGEFPEWFSELEISVRADHSGTFCDDFQIILPRDESLAFQERLYRIFTGKGLPKNAKHTPEAQNNPAIIRRTFLANAEFLVRIMADDHVDELNAAICSPAFVSYLGRKAFAPEFPFYLGVGDSGQLTKLPAYVQPRPQGTKGTDEEASEYRVTIHHLDPLGGESREHAVAIPIVESRQEWLDVVGSSLKRREIPRHLHA